MHCEDGSGERAVKLLELIEDVMGPDEFIGYLKGRYLEAIYSTDPNIPISTHTSTIILCQNTLITKIKLRNKKPLSMDIFLKGGWHMQSNTIKDADAFLKAGLKVYDYETWGLKNWQYCYLHSSMDNIVARTDCPVGYEIVRIGSHFYKV